MHGGHVESHSWLSSVRGLETVSEWQVRSSSNDLQHAVDTRKDEDDDQSWRSKTEMDETGEKSIGSLVDI